MIRIEPPPARSYLYVPGTERGKLDKSVGRGADAVIADLEDAVAPADKAAARRTVHDWLTMPPGGDIQTWVRIDRASLEEDVAATATAGLTGIVLPKADPASLRELDRLLADREAALGRPSGSIAVLPLVESAAGLSALAETAAGPRVHRLGLGEADLIGELGLRPGPERTELLPIRLQLVVAAAAAGLVAPVAPTSTDFRDLESFRTTSRALLALGFRGRTAIHPTQVPVINEVFTPGEEEVAAARTIVTRFEQADSGVFVDDDGRMVDAAVVRSAREILARARG